MAGKIRVLVVDDSDLARDLIVAILSSDKEIAVVGEAKNGVEAVEMVGELKPDIVTIDIEMPVMNGLDAIERIMAVNALPILVVTTRGDAHTAYAAISKGALDLVVKPDVNLDEAQDFISKIKLLSRIKVITHIRGKRSTAQTPAPPPLLFTGGTSDRAIAIASSTGGPEALSIILSRLPEDFPCPIVVAQHNSDGFIPGMVEWLKRISKIPIKVAEDSEKIFPGRVYVSPSEKHMQISEAKTVSFIERNPKDIYRPSCDMLLSSVARVYGPQGVGVVLTGMGSDGVLGVKAIKEHRGLTVAQDQKTSIVFGMPKVAIETGCIDAILPLDEISNHLLHIANGKHVRTV